MVTGKLIKALKLTADRIDDFLETNREIFREVSPSPYGLMAFCSFLVVAGYAPSKEYFPDTVVNRGEADTLEFKGYVIDSMTKSLMQRHSPVLGMMKNEEEKERQVRAVREQVAHLLEEKYAEYFGFFKEDVERLTEKSTEPYANLSDAFMRDVLGREDLSGSEIVKAPESITIGLCLSTTVSGLMAFFDRPDDTDISGNITG